MIDGLNASDRTLFEDLRQRAREEVDRGELDRALATCDEAMAWAEAHGDEDDRDLVRCNRSSVLIHQGTGEQVVSQLQRLLMRSRNMTNRYLAAYNISQFYDLAKNFQKSSFYAEQALSYAQQTDCSEFVGRSHNRLANVFVIDSRFDQAEAHYREALSLLPADPSAERGVLLANIGYCMLSTERPFEGLGKLLAARRMLRQLNFGWQAMLCRLHLGLCYGFIEIERPHRAVFHGQTALTAAEVSEDVDLLKKSLYLLGESQKIAGEIHAAEDHFTRLQMYYPENPYLVDLLLNTETHKLINLWA